jgi:hypothetical protein
MTADDTYTVHFRLENGCTGVMHSSCAIGGQFVAATKVTGTHGSAWLQGEELWIDRGAGATRVADPDDVPVVAPDPPPTELLRTTYDYWHSMGIDLAPYTRCASGPRRRRFGEPTVDDPPAATFVDGPRAARARRDPARHTKRVGDGRRGVTAMSAAILVGWRSETWWAASWNCAAPTR